MQKVQQTLNLPKSLSARNQPPAVNNFDNNNNSNSVLPGVAHSCLAGLSEFLSPFYFIFFSSPVDKKKKAAFLVLLLFF